MHSIEILIELLSVFGSLVVIVSSFLIHRKKLLIIEANSFANKTKADFSVSENSNKQRVSGRSASSEQFNERKAKSDDYLKTEEGNSIRKDNPEVRVRAFRAIDEPETCELFIEGHRHVLLSLGVKNVSNSKDQWPRNPAVFVVVVESMDRKKIFGGARVQVAGGTQPLPIELAIGAMDPRIIDLVWYFAQQGTGELCGLWNSREISGVGIGTIFLIRVAVAISYQIGIQSLFALCAPYTISPAEAVGMERETEIGFEGTFYYPKINLVAETMILKDVPTLIKASNEERNEIMKIRKNINTTRVEILRRKEITIHYELEIPKLESWDIEQTIKDATKTFFKNSGGENDLDFLKDLQFDLQY